ncbi:MAG: hypothetical protein QG608_3387 [Actinomycetota bacterium]|nr:hypothetical protein [Actinomycetota bacterium]
MSVGFRTTEGLRVRGEETHLSRSWIEQRKLACHFPGFRLVRTGSGDVAAAEGALLTGSGHLYGLRILLPRDYPHSLPKVEPVGWRARGPHVFGPDSLCLLRARQWTPDMTLAFLVAEAALWLTKYETWQRTGKWPGLEQGVVLSDELRDFVGRGLL